MPISLEEVMLVEERVAVARQVEGEEAGKRVEAENRMVEVEVTSARPRL